MTVKELILYLGTCDENAEVLTCDNEYGYGCIEQEDILQMDNVTVEKYPYTKNPNVLFDKAVILQ